MPDAVSTDGQPLWEEARWIGVIDQADVDAELLLENSAGFAHARLLLRDGPNPRGFVDLPVTDGRVDRDILHNAIEKLPAAMETPPEPDRLPTVSVIVCTRDRPDSLRRALRSIIAVDYPDLEVVVVDNNPLTRTGETVADELRDPRIRVVGAPVAGLSRARNVGLRKATSEIVAYTDDDVVVDPHWIRGLVQGFARGHDVSCVTGLVPTGALLTPVHAYFDRRVSWAAQLRPDIFRATDQRPDLPLFPFCVGRFGTGANFAFRRSELVRVGGFDEALGAGAKTGGGEDIDMFLRVLLSRRAIAFEPSSIVWHRHRDDTAGLSKQVHAYGTGLSACMTVHALNPATAAQLARVVVAGSRHMWSTTGAARDSVALASSGDLAKAERRGILAGPLSLVRERLAGSKRRPLAR